ncbi:hypothetical protein J3U76_08420 [Oceanisphaera sp. DM8]|uniref:Uncharacterized protein n=1 Tax=Oceanisphaera pacifica TaxID=2818389 RepID=A0ABS3NGD8_9GAMM|nr:hypothetical protein [Oceanisphaera pacifica]
MLTLTDKWHDIASLSQIGVDGVGVVSLVMMLEVISEWLLSWAGLSGDVLEYQAQLSDLLPIETIQSLIITSLLVFVPLLLQWLLLLLYLLLQTLHWPRLTSVKPNFDSPLPQYSVLRSDHGCRAPPLALSGF